LICAIAYFLWKFKAKPYLPVEFTYGKVVGYFIYKTQNYHHHYNSILLLFEGRFINRDLLTGLLQWFTKQTDLIARVVVTQHLSESEVQALLERLSI
jgi:hypothetical protein